MDKASILISVVLVFLFSFSIIDKSFAVVTRDGMMSIAKNYKNYEWTPTENNVCHKITKNNGCCIKWNSNRECVVSVDCRVDTPDRNTYTEWIAFVGWKWEKENKEYVSNTSIPYNWGGFSSLEEFDSGIENGLCAGNKYTIGGRQTETIGIDCSGFISRVWDFKLKESTWTLPKISKKLEEYNYMERGDILNIKGNHVMLFKEFDFINTENLWVYESSSNDWKVNDRSYNIKDELQRDNYIPYSLFNPINIELVIDRSGSMGREKMNDAKEASKQFVDFMESGDKIGIVSFADNASKDYMNYQLTEIDGSKPSVTKTEAKTVIDAISAGNVTSIGSGLKMGQDQLNNYGGEGAKIMILLSDGYENRPPYVSEVLDGIIEDKIKVCTIGLGNSANQELLNEIASKTGCIYKFAANSSDLQFIYKILQAEISREDMLKMEKMTIASGETITKFVYIDSSISAATFSISWEGSDVDLILTDPNNNIIDHSINNPDIEFIEGSTYEFYKIDGPKHGGWKMEIKAIDIPTDGEDVVLSVSGENAIIFEANLNKTEYSKEEKIRITTFVQDPIMDIDDPQYVYETDMSIEAINPNQEISEFQLYDDGEHGDGEASDGVYANTFNDTTSSGSYTFTIKASGFTNREGDPFTREKTISTFVSEDIYQNLPPIADAGGPYSGCVSAPIIFDGSESSDPENQSLKYRWDFNSDGTFETDWLNTPTAEYIYGNSFVGKVVLEVSDGELTSTSATEVIIQDDRELKSAKELKQEAIEKLESILANKNPVKKLIESAIKSINKSLEEKYWLDDSKLNPKIMRGVVVFNMEKAAVLKLKAAQKKNDETRIQTAIDKLVEADKILAKVSLSEAKEIVNSINNFAKKIIAKKSVEKAEKEIVKAEIFFNGGEKAQAINCYKKAWIFSEVAKKLKN